MTKIARFDGAMVWTILPPQQQGAIGALALELFAAWYVAEREEDAQCESLSVHERAARAATTILLPKLQATIFDAIPAGFLHAEDGTPRIPLLMGPVCQVCGCSDRDACFPPCAWVEPDLCSACQVEEA